MSHKFINQMKIFLLLALMLLSFNVMAADPVTPAPAPTGDLSETLGMTGGNTFEQDIKRAINGLTSAISSFAETFRGTIAPDATKLLGLLSIISISLAGIKLSMTSGSLSEPMSRLLTTIFTIGIASFLISPAGYSMMVIDGIDGTMNKLASYALPGSSNLADGFSNFMQSEFQILGDVISAFKDFGMLDILDVGFIALLVVFMFLALLLMSLIGMIAVLTSLVMVAIALALGPIFIPFLVLEKTSFLFDGWLKFTINAALTKVVVAILLGIGTAAFAALGTNFAGGITESMAGTMLAALAISGVIGTLMLTAPGIASAITSGGAISQDGFAGRMHSTAKAMSRNASVQGTHGVANTVQKYTNAKPGGGVQNALNRLRTANSGGRQDGLKPIVEKPPATNP